MSRQLERIKRDAYIEQPTYHRGNRSERVYMLNHGDFEWLVRKAEQAEMNEEG